LRCASPASTFTPWRRWPCPPRELPSRSSTLPPPCASSSRARAADHRFVLTAANAADVTAICAKLDGLPLAIELAAAWTATLPPAALLTRLEPRLPLLSGGPRDAPERQRTMRSAIAWSLDLLALEERTLFRRLAVFAGGFELEAAERVALAGNDLGVAALAAKSLLSRGDDGPGEPRFALLETVRETALEELAASGEEDSVRDAHAAWCLDLAERAEGHWWRPDQQVWEGRLTAEAENLRAALDWAERRGSVELGLRLTGGLGWHWYMHAPIGEGLLRLERLLARAAAVAPPVRAKALLAAGVSAANAGDMERARVALAEGEALIRAAGDPWLEALAAFARGAGRPPG
jgi:predicted ATPase